MPLEDVDFIERKLNEFDKDRIDRGLQRAKQILEERGPMNTGKLSSIEMPPVLALFEALCCMPYLSLPENRATFNYVFENTQLKKPLKMQCGIIPTMTYFLFEENPFRVNFARAAWHRKPADSLTQDEWDWSVGDQLTAAILSTSLAKGSPTSDKIRRFWQGFQVMIPALSERRILENLRGMEVSPSIYYLALEHLGTDSPDALDAVLRGLRGLMGKSSNAFWAAYDQVTPSQMVEEIFKSTAFLPFLDRSLQPEWMEDYMGVKSPFFAIWTQSLIRSLPLNRRSDACESLLRHLFETFRLKASQEARSTSTLAGLVALGESLDGYLHVSTPFNTGTQLIIVNQLLNSVVQYRDVIISASQLKQGDRYNVGLSRAAIGIIHSALALDARATFIEWGAMCDDVPVQEAFTRDSGALWESFLEMLWSGQVDLAKAMLTATMPLRNIEKFIPKRGEKLSSSEEKFNQRFQQQTTAIARMLGRLSDFNPSDLDTFCSGVSAETIHPIAASLFHSEEAIRDAGFELVKAITSEVAPSDAITKMLEEYFTPFLGAFAEAVKNLLGENDNRSPWAHMLPLLKCSELVLNGLCDPSEGQLRLKTLTSMERAVVKNWWDSQWRIIGHGFQKMRHWHVRVDKKLMENFCRDVMELANKFLAQDGLMASALSEQSNGALWANGDAAGEAMKTVLGPPTKYSSDQLAEMLQLRDKYLIEGILNTIKKLVTRLQSCNMTLPNKTLVKLNKVLKKQWKDGVYDYPSKTNLTDAQRIELLKALGEDAEIDEQFVKPAEEAREKERALRQSKLDFSKMSGTALNASVRSHLDTLTPHSDKRKSILETLKQQPQPKPLIRKAEPKPTLSAAAIKEARAKEKAEKARRDAEAIAKARALRAPPKIVAGEGSGLQGVTSVRGKDHTPALKDEIMVGTSSEDEESEEDEILAGRAGPSKKVLDEAERRRRLLETQGPVKKIKVQRSARDMRARLIPPMDVLHQAILEWDIFHGGNDPPNGYRCEGVSDTYSNPASYKQTFFPLLINEAWRSFVTAKDEATSRPFGIKVLNRMTVDKFLEVTGSIPVLISRDRGLSEGDIVIFSKGSDPLNQPKELHCLARIWKTQYKKENVEVLFRLNAKGNAILSALLPASEFTVVKITNMTTIEREYAALESLQYYDLMDEVLKAAPSPMLNYAEEKIEAVMDNYQLNRGQAKAILNAKDNDGFTLVQGPPGTGKTKTIVAMVGSLMTGHIKNNTGAVSISRPGGGAPNYGTSKKLLVCAPSNAAVDELVLRMKEGIKTMNGTHHKIKVLRLGRSEAINAAVRDVTLDELVKARMEKELNSGTVSDRDKMHQEASELKSKVNDLRPQLEAARETGDRQLAMKLQRELDDLKSRQARIGNKIEADKASGQTFAREVDIKRRQVQQEILDQAQVLCATLSGSGHEMFKGLNVEFETVIIDEAAQCVELSALIPLKYGCSKCILVGDPKQLPPTVLSQSAARYGYDQSLFVRMQKNHSKHVHLLDMQYRMHPEISLFPSQEFYEGLLQDGSDMAAMRRQEWHRSVLMGPYRFFDVKGSQERGPRNQSLVNEEELKVAMQLYRRFKEDYGGIELKGKIGIITPYKAQLFRLRQRFADVYGEQINEQIEFNTTDAFQGRECEIIIFSCVRASPTGGIGFMTDIRRMNVGLTRARSSLWILGDSRALVQGEFWAKLIDDAKRRNRYTSGNIMAMLSKPGQKVSGEIWTSLAASSSNQTKRAGEAENDRDTVMSDASLHPRAHATQQTRPAQEVRPSQQGQSALQNAPAQSLPRREPPAPTMPYRGPGIAGLNERGEPVQVSMPRVSGVPMIQTSTGGSSKKRPHDGPEGQPGAKKVRDKPEIHDLTLRFAKYNLTRTPPTPYRFLRQLLTTNPYYSIDPAAAVGHRPSTRPHAESTSVPATADRPVSNGSPRTGGPTQTLTASSTTTASKPEPWEPWHEWVKWAECETSGWWTS